MAHTAPTLPSSMYTIDDAFVHTWYEIRPEAIDNIIDSIVLWAALRDKGCFTEQVGGEVITRTLRYGTKTSKAVKKGDIFSQGETELKTMGLWQWKYMSGHVQRSVFDDQKNNGKFRIKSYIQSNLEAARESLEEAFETDLTTAYSATCESSPTGKIQSFNEMIPPYTYRSAAYKYGNVDRSLCTWWLPKYQAMTANPEVNLLSDMLTLYLACSDNGKQPPKLIATTSEWFQIYLEMALDASQIIKEESTHLADLGFEVARFNGKPVIWTNDLIGDPTSGAYQNMFMLNTDFIEVVYDPELWFSPTGWKDIPLQGERIMHILCAANLISTQLRRHGRLYENAGY